MSIPIKTNHGFDERAIPVSPIYGCMKEEDALVIHGYPYGARLKCPMIMWVGLKRAGRSNYRSSGRMRICTRTPTRAYCEEYTKQFRLFEMAGVKEYYETNPPETWNKTKQSIYMLFACLFEGEFKATPLNGSLAGRPVSSSFQLHRETPIIRVLEFLEACEAAGEKCTELSIGNMPASQAVILHQILMNASKARGNSLSKSFGLREKGQVRYKRFLELIANVPEYERLGYL